MSTTSLFAVTAILLEILPVLCHRLITNPYPDQEWDSIIVSSDPIKITERRQNDTTALKLRQILKPQKRSFEECPPNNFKCLYGQDDDKDNNQIVDKFLSQYSNLADVKVNDGDVKNSTDVEENESSPKSYWSMVDSQTHNHPYDDKNGWVTLDPVPWSSSKISKWYPNKVGVQENKPWGYGPTSQRPPQQSFWVSGGDIHTQRPTSQWGIGTNDIITDNKPSGFPTENYNSYGGSPQGPIYHHENGFYENYNGFQHNQGFKGNQPSEAQQSGHPSTYPINGNGEWVLLSTTKGYSHPQRHRWAGKTDFTKTDQRYVASRKMKPIEISRYHEESLVDKNGAGGNRKSDGIADDELDSSKLNVTNEVKTPIQILYTGSTKTGQPVRTFRRKVRLQVLPSLENSSTSHGGLLEVDSNSQTVDEAQQEDEKLKKLQTIANVKKNRFRGYKIVPMNKVAGKGMSNKNLVTLAAVGAGMIPATMALLVPMALGRRKRSLPNRHPGYENENVHEVDNLTLWRR